MKFSLLLAVIAFAIAGCASTPDLITATPAGGAISLSPTSVVGKDILAAQDNYQSANKIGIIPPDYPALGCVNDVVAKLNLRADPNAPPPSFAPQVDGVISGASVLDILAYQAKSMGPLAISNECYALIGKLQVDNLKALAKVAPIALGQPGLKAFNTAVPALIQAAPRLMH